MKAQWESTIHPLQKNLKYRPRWSMVYQFPHWKSRYYINIHMSWYFNCNITSTSIYQRCDLSTVTIYQPLHTSTVTHYKLYDQSRYQNVNCNKLIYFLIKGVDKPRVEILLYYMTLRASWNNIIVLMMYCLCNEIVDKN